MMFTSKSSADRGPKSEERYDKLTIQLSNHFFMMSAADALT